MFNNNLACLLTANWALWPCRKKGSALKCHIKKKNKNNVYCCLVTWNKCCCFQVMIYSLLLLRRGAQECAKRTLTWVSEVPAALWRWKTTTGLCIQWLFALSLFICRLENSQGSNLYVRRHSIFQVDILLPEREAAVHFLPINWLSS